MNSSLVELLHYQQQTENDTACALQAIQLSQRDHENDSLTDDTPTFKGKPKLHFNWIFKLENIGAVTKS